MNAVCMFGAFVLLLLAAVAAFAVLFCTLVWLHNRKPK